MLRTLAKNPRTYVFAVLDCCREPITDAMRGTGGDHGEEIQEDAGDKRNLILVFSCPPDKGTDAASTVTVDLFKTFKRIANPFDGSVLLPNPEFLRWIPGNNGEIYSLTTRDLKLWHSEWETQTEQVAGDDILSQLQALQARMRLEITSQAFEINDDEDEDEEEEEEKEEEKEEDDEK